MTAQEEKDIRTAFERALWVLKREKTTLVHVQQTNDNNEPSLVVAICFGTEFVKTAVEALDALQPAPEKTFQWKSGKALVTHAKKILTDKE